MSQEKIRVEIVGNHAVEEDLIEHLEDSLPNLRYTLVGDVQGAGSCGKRLGDGVWPELNFLLILYLSQDEAFLALGSVREVKRTYPNEGLKAWTWTVTEEV